MFFVMYKRKKNNRCTKKLLIGRSWAIRVNIKPIGPNFSMKT